MKRNFLCALAAGLLAAGSVTAGPVLRSDLPAEPAWVIHLDVDAFRASSFGKLIAGELEKPEPARKLSAFKDALGFDPSTQLHAISVYGLGNKREEGVLVVYGDFDAGRLETLVKAAKEYQSSKHRSRIIHSWIDDRKKTADAEPKRVFGAIAGNRLVFAPTSELVASALDVVDGFSANMGGTKTFASLGQPAEGSFLQAIGRKLDVGEGNPNAALVRLSQETRLEAFESAGKITASLNLSAKDEEVAGHMNSIAQGLLALIKMQTDKPEQRKLAEGLVVKQEGSSVNAVLSMPSADLIALLKAKAEKTAQD